MIFESELAEQSIAGSLATCEFLSIPFVFAVERFCSALDFVEFISKVLTELALPSLFVRFASFIPLSLLS